MTLFLTKILYFRTINSSMTPFLVSSYFATHPITLLLEIFGGPDAWDVPSPQILGGDRPPVSPKSPPIHRLVCPLVYIPLASQYNYIIYNNNNNFRVSN